MAKQIHRFDTHVLVIGSGIAGLRAALEAARSGKQTLLVSKSGAGKATNTTLAGGLFTVSTESFSIEDHLQRTLKAGGMLNRKGLVEQFVTQAPAELKALQEMGLDGHYQDSSFHCRTTKMVGGPEISSVLVRACREAGVTFLEDVMVTALLTADGVCGGAVGFHKRNGDVFGIRARATVLAFGGAGAIYAQTDNAPGATGDGYAVGLEAGLELMDMEFVQFYPLVYAGSGRSHMILPAWFADWGKVTNRMGEDLKEKYGLHDKPVAIVSRDRFSQALYREITLGNDIRGALLLDLRGVDFSRFPRGEFLKKSYRKKISIDTEPILITPACHHTMGGIVIHADCRTTLGGLFAAGEVTGGIHGANRMGGNALCEALVFGKIAARSALAFADSNEAVPDAGERINEIVNKPPGKTETPTDLSAISDAMRSLKQVMWEDVGIIRSETGLKRGVEKIERLAKTLENRRAADPRQLLRLLECRNAALTAWAIGISALRRTETRGSHFRDDFPREDPGWQKHIHVKLTGGRPTAC